MQPTRNRPSDEGLDFHCWICAVLSSGHGARRPPTLSGGMAAGNQHGCSKTTPLRLMKWGYGPLCVSFSIYPSIGQTSLCIYPSPSTQRCVCVCVQGLILICVRYPLVWDLSKDPRPVPCCPSLPTSGPAQCQYPPDFPLAS